MNALLKRALPAILALLITVFSMPAGALAEGEDPFDPLWSQEGRPYAYVLLEDGNATVHAQGGEVPLGNASTVMIHIAFAQIAGQGLVDCDAPLASVLGDDVLKITKDREISVAALLDHTAGWENDWRELEGPLTLEEYVRRAEPRSVYVPGTVKTAARFSDAVKALIVEKATGLSFDEYVSKNILEPLGMANTHYVKNGAWACSGLVSTAEDMEILLRQLAARCVDLMDENAWAFMTERSYSVHPLMPGLAHGFPEFSASAYCLGLNAGDGAAFGGFRFFPETGRAVWFAAGDLTGSDMQHMPERLLAAFEGDREIEVKTEGLPLTAPMAGEFIQADRPDGGYMELSRDMVGLQIIKSKVYTEYSNAKLYVYSTYYSSQYLNTFRGFTNLYFNTVDQVDDHLFRDIYDNLLYFVTDEEGKVVKFVFEDDEYVPVPAARSIVAVNLTIWVIYLCMLFFVVSLVMHAVMRISDRISYWPVDPVSWTALAFCVTELLLGINVCLLLYFSCRSLSYAACRVHIVLNWILTAALAAEAAFMAFRWKKSELRPFERGVYIAGFAGAGLFLLMMLWWGLF